MTAALDFDALIQPGRVHRSLYVDPDIFAAEMTKIFAGTWVFLAHESEIPEPNNFKSVRVGLRPLIVTRDADGRLHALFNRCSHRASTVCQAASGSAERFQCSYHGWTYSNSGELVVVPFERGYGADFDKRELGLRRVPRLETHRGFIFGTLNRDAPPLAEWLGPAARIIDGFVDRSPTGRIQVRNPHRLVYRGNWKLAWDNAADGLHATFAHRSIVMLNEQRHGGQRALSQFGTNPDDTGMYAACLGNGHSFFDQRPGLTGTFWEAQRPVPGREALEAHLHDELGADEAADELERAPGAMINLSIFPNLMLLGNQFQVIEPVSVSETRLNFYAVAAEGVAAEVNALRMRIAEDFPTLGNPDDIEIFERCQTGLAIPEIEWVNISKGLGTKDETVDENGVTRVPATHEAPVRSYLEQWQRLMAAEPRLTVEPQS